MLLFCVLPMPLKLVREVLGMLVICAIVSSIISFVGIWDGNSQRLKLLPSLNGIAEADGAGCAPEAHEVR